MTRVNSTGKESSSNFSPDNGTGLAVRTAIKDILESLRTVNSAAGDPSGAANLAAYQLHIDSDTDTLKIRNGANSAFVTLGNVSQTNFGFLSASGGTLTGVLGASAGSSSAPSLNFGDSNTGLFKKSTNQIGISTAGTEQLFLDQNGVTLNAQNEIRFGDSDSSNYAAIKAPATISSNFTLTLPTTDGNDGEFLKVGSSGALSFATVAASSLTGNTLASGVTASSLTSVGTLSDLTVSGLSTLNETRLASIKDTSGNNSSTAEELNQGRAKAWCRFTVSGGTPSINDSFNISSITDNAAGDFDFVFATAMANANYAAVSTSEVGSSNINIPCLVASGQATTDVRFQYFRITTLGGGGVPIDPPAGAVTVFGD